MSAGRETKRCPDCAEDVLAEARVCRYCGYRFDGGARATDGSPGLHGLFAKLLARPSGDVTNRPLTEVVAAWGVEIEPDEEVTFLAFGHLAGRYGYLVVTGERFLFVEHAGSGSYRQLEARSRASIVDVSVTGGRRRRLTLRGADYELQVGGLTREMAREANAVLAATRPP